ncbi:hypothetical protein ACLB2K_016165 [Fragaria x ananassa]
MAQFKGIQLQEDMSSGTMKARHGIMQLRNPWSDGPEYITQCPIQPGTNFTYKVLLSTEEGTVWWHAHSDWSRASVHGAIVILPTVGSTYAFPQPYEDEAKLVYLCLSLQCGTLCPPLECLPFWGCFAARVTLASGLLPALPSLDVCEGPTKAISTG